MPRSLFSHRPLPLGSLFVVTVLRIEQRELDARVKTLVSELLG